MFYMWFAYVWHLSLGNPRCVCSMCFVCVFETVYVYVWAGYSNTGSIVEAFGILIKLGACWRPCKSPLHGCMYETDELVVYETIVVCLPSRPRVDNSHMPPWDSSWVTCMFLIPWRKEAHCGHSEPWQNVGWPSWRWAHPTHMRPSPRKKKLFNLSTEKDGFPCRLFEYVMLEHPKKVSCMTASGRDLYRSCNTHLQAIQVFLCTSFRSMPPWRIPCFHVWKLRNKFCFRTRTCRTRMNGNYCGNGFILCVATRPGVSKGFTARTKLICFFVFSRLLAGTCPFSRRSLGKLALQLIRTLLTLSTSRCALDTQIIFTATICPGATFCLIEGRKPRTWTAAAAPLVQILRWRMVSHRSCVTGRGGFANSERCCREGKEGNSCDWHSADIRSRPNLASKPREIPATWSTAGHTSSNRSDISQSRGRQTFDELLVVGIKIAQHVSVQGVFGSHLLSGPLSLSVSLLNNIGVTWTGQSLLKTGLEVGANFRSHAVMLRL